MGNIAAAHTPRFVAANLVVQCIFNVYNLIHVFLASLSTNISMFSILQVDINKPFFILLLCKMMLHFDS